MFLKGFFLVAALGALTSAQNHCCFPALYESGLADVFATFNADTGVASAARRYQRMYMDYSDPNNRLYRRERLTVDLYTQERRIRSFLVKDHIEYRFNDTACVASAAESQTFRGCITSEADFRGSIYIGLGEHRLNLHVWRIPIMDNVTAETHVTDNCVLVAFSMAGRQGNVDFARSATMLGFTEGISNRDVFNVPSHCPTVSAL